MRGLGESHRDCSRSEVTLAVPSNLFDPMDMARISIGTVEYSGLLGESTYLASRPPRDLSTLHPFIYRPTMRNGGLKVC